MSGMEAGRTRWTDERRDDLALGVRDDIRELRFAGLIVETGLR
jgi:hypothetical protein